MFLNTETQNHASPSTVECAGVHGIHIRLTVWKFGPFLGQSGPKSAVDLSGLSLFLIGLFWVNRPNFRLVGNMHASPRMDVKLVQSPGPKKNRLGTRSSALFWMTKKIMICTILYSICKHWKLRLLFWIKQKHLLKKISITELREGDMSKGNHHCESYISRHLVWYWRPSAWSLLRNFNFEKNLRKRTYLKEDETALKTPSPTRSSPENSFPFAVSYQDFSRHSRGGGRRTRSSVYSARSSLVKTCATRGNFQTKPEILAGRVRGGRRTASSVYSARSSLVNECATREEFPNQTRNFGGKIRH